jgi:hypothetical protein
VGLAGTSLGANRSTQSNYRAGVSYVTGSHNIKDRLHLMHAWRYATQEPQNSVTLAMRGGVPFSSPVRTPIQLHETAQLQRGHLRAGSVAAEPADDELRRASRHAEGRMDAQDLPAGPVHAGASLRRHRERAELEGHRSRASARPTTCSATARRRSRGSIGRYVVGESYTLAQAVNPIQTEQAVTPSHAHWALLPA